MLVAYSQITRLIFSWVYWCMTAIWFLHIPMRTVRTLVATRNRPPITPTPILKKFTVFIPWYLFFIFSLFVRYKIRVVGPVLLVNWALATIRNADGDTPIELARLLNETEIHRFLNSLAASS